MAMRCVRGAREGPGGAKRGPELAETEPAMAVSLEKADSALPGALACPEAVGALSGELGGRGSVVLGRASGEPPRVCGQSGRPQSRSGLESGF